MSAARSCTPRRSHTRSDAAIGGTGTACPCHWTISLSGATSGPCSSMPVVTRTWSPLTTGFALSS
jgi:hypothetical protein